MKIQASCADAIDEDKASGAELADDRASWYRPLAPDLVSYLMSRVAARPSPSRVLTDLRLTAEDRMACGRTLHRRATIWKQDASL